MKLKGIKVAIVGMGQSGRAVYRFATKQGAEVVLNDTREEDAIQRELKQAGLAAAPFIAGHPDFEALNKPDLVVASPGVPWWPALRDIASRGVPVIDEVELASRYIQAPIIGITGTNGKSTVTSLVGDMCARLGRPLFVGGNLGTPLIEVVGTPAASPDGIIVVELSSYQLERISSMRVNHAAILNVTPDHLPRHGTLANYLAAKANILRFQRAGDVIVVPDEPQLLAVARASSGRTISFGSAEADIAIDGEFIVDEASGWHFPIAELSIKGQHNVLNASAAIALGHSAGVPLEAIEHTLRNFKGLAHRFEEVGQLKGVVFIDDSKATNVDAAVKAVQSSRGKVLLIAGGLDKGGAYDALVTAMQRQGKAAFLIGEAKEKIQQAFTQGGVQSSLHPGMNEAVHAAFQAAAPGDWVILAPACASQDMYRSYVERGQDFRAAVARLDRV